jgi:hypothetical protein
LNDFGRNSLDDLEVKEKQLKEMMQRRQLQALQYDANLLLMHTNQVRRRAAGSGGERWGAVGSRGE